jgi:hypothetical protein
VQVSAVKTRPDGNFTRIAQIEIDSMGG